MDFLTFRIQYGIALMLKIYVYTHNVKKCNKHIELSNIYLLIYKKYFVLIY